MKKGNRSILCEVETEEETQCGDRNNSETSRTSLFGLAMFFEPGYTTVAFLWSWGNKWIEGLWQGYPDRSSDHSFEPPNLPCDPADCDFGWEFNQFFSVVSFNRPQRFRQNVLNFSFLGQRSWCLKMIKCSSWETHNLVILGFSE